MDLRQATPCPTDLALERLLLLEGPHEQLRPLQQHVAGCARCGRRVAGMESAARGLRRRPQVVSARVGFTRAERRNARNLMLLALIPAVAVAGGLAAVGSLSPSPDKPPPQALELRPDLRPARLRELPLRGGPVQLGQGALEGAPAAGPSRPFVLEHTDVEIAVSAFVQRAVVTQTFKNPFSVPVEALYVFPLPEDAAVDDLELRVGSRVIRGEIHRREEARRRYEQAKSEGRRAALLDQERPNLFTQSIANILPGERVQVRIRYAAAVPYDDGVFTLNFPMTVGPRYVPGSALAGEPQGAGTSPDTDRVLDASRITPPVDRTGRDISVRVALDAALPLGGLWSASHRLLAARPSPQTAAIELDPSDRIPNKDLILRWTVAGPALAASALASGAGGNGTFALLLAPPSKDALPEPLPREMVFVIDTSCSMSGRPLAAAKGAMALALEHLNPDDTFLLIDFADAASAFHAEPLPATRAYVERALAYLQALPASGGTNQLSGIRAALDRPGDPRRLRTVLFMTDGFIGNEAEVLGATERLLGSARLFAFGVGSSVNHYLLAELARSGRGFYQYLRPDEDPTPAVDRFARRLERPLLTDLTVDFGGLEVAQLEPSVLPDLFDAQPLVLLGRYRKPGRGTVTLRGRRGAEVVELRVPLVLPERDERHQALGSLWARARIAVLERQLHQGERSEVIREITTLGLEHRLVTAYTSFVAVDHERAAQGPLRRSVEAVEPPDLTRAPPALAGKMGKKGSSAPRTEDGDGFDKSFGPGFGGRDVGGLGLAGHGRGGGGTGQAYGGGKGADVHLPPKPAVVPRLENEPAAALGSLSKEPILRVVRRHTAELRALYQRRLRERPELAGTATVELVIDERGVVTAARLVRSTLQDAPLEKSLLELVRKMKFPPNPGGGQVVVSYPFSFQPGH